MGVRHLILSGLSGSGKSAVGARLARLLDRPFVDLDRALETRAGMSVAEMFRTLGEPQFRRHEANLLVEVLDRSPAVIAAGGGALVADSSRLAASHCSLVVWLRVRPETALRRVEQSEERPLLASKPLASLTHLLESRESTYAQCDFAVDTDEKTADEIAATIAKWCVNMEQS